jgi:drug/metabolite transporter (DMT)-like permease
MTTRNHSTLIGCLFMLAAAVSWGGMFPVAKATLAHIDAFYMTSLRYGITAIIMVAILWAKEGRPALNASGRIGELLLFGTAGFSGFGLFVFTGLRASTPAHGAILVALMPLLTALLNAALSRTLPKWPTMGSIALALGGVALVVSDGHPAALLASESAAADLMILAGVLCWVIYTLGARRFPGWSPLRYSSLTVLWGVPSILGFTAIAEGLGFAHLPSAGTVMDVAPHLAYIVVFASVVAVLGWNAGVQRLGAVNGVLFINFVPISAFAIQALRGSPLSAAEILGGVLVVLALLLNNLLQRGLPVPAWRAPRPAPCTQAG